MTQFTEIFQPEIWFFRPDDSPPSKEVRTQWADPENPDNPLHSFVGNQHAVRRLCRVAFEVFGRHNRECNRSFALIGPTSTGKATLSRLFGELTCLPFVEIDARSCGDLNNIAIAIAKVLEETKIDGCQYQTLEMQDLGGGRLVVPPCIVFIDEVHALSKKITKQLFAGRLETNGWKFNTKAICWIVSTNELLLPDGLDRFTTIRLTPLSVEEVAEVVALHHPDFPVEVCHLIAKQVRSPREALAFAKEVGIELEMHGGDWKEVAAIVAKDWGLLTSTPWVNRISRNGRN